MEPPSFEGVSPPSLALASRDHETVVRSDSENERGEVTEPPTVPVPGPDVPRRIHIRIVDGHANAYRCPVPVRLEFVSRELVTKGRARVRVEGEASVGCPETAKYARLATIAGAGKFVTLEDVGDTQIVLKLPTAVYCNVRVVVDATGQPIAGARLLCANERGDVPQVLGAVNDRGVIELWLPIGVMLSADAEGRCPAEGIIVSSVHSGGEIVLRCGVFSQTVAVHVCSEGQPIVGATVIVGRRWSSIQHGAVLEHATWRVTCREDVTDSAGNACIGGDWSGYRSVEVVCIADGFAIWRANVKTDIVLNGSVVKATGRVVADLCRGKQLRGVVVGSDHAPVVGTRVTCDAATLSEESVFTGKDGQFVFSGLDLRYEREIQVGGGDRFRSATMAAGGSVGQGDMRFVLADR